MRKALPPIFHQISEIKGVHTTHVEKVSPTYHPHDYFGSYAFKFKSISGWVLHLDLFFNSKGQGLDFYYDLYWLPINVAKTTCFSRYGLGPEDIIEDRNVSSEGQELILFNLDILNKAERQDYKV